MATLCITDRFDHHLIIGSATHCRFQVNVRDVDWGEEGNATSPRVRHDAQIEHPFPPSIKWQGGYYTLIEVPQAILDNIPRLEPHS